MNRVAVMIPDEVIPNQWWEGFSAVNLIPGSGFFIGEVVVH